MNRLQVKTMEASRQQLTQRGTEGVKKKTVANFARYYIAASHSSNNYIHIHRQYKS